MNQTTPKNGIWGLMVLICAIMMLMPSFVKAQGPEAPRLSVELLAPDQVKDVPGTDTMIRAKVTNLSEQVTRDVMAYITLADLGKHMTVNLEDYSADKPVVIGDLQAKETKTIELPIRFVYTSRYHLYVTAVSSESFAIQSSNAIPVEIVSNSNMDPSLVQAVSFGMPALLFGAAATVFAIRRKKRQVLARLTLEN